MLLQIQYHKDHMDNQTTLKKRLGGINKKSHVYGGGELSQRDHFSHTRLLLCHKD